MPQRIGRSSSFLMRIAHTPIIPPSIRLPVSPMKTWAGKALYQRKPIRAPTKAAMNTAISPLPGIYMIFR